MASLMLFNQSVEQADAAGWLSGEHFSVDGTLIQAWASHKSFVAKDEQDGDGQDGDGQTFKGTRRGNQTYQSKSDPDARLYRKGKSASELRYMGQALGDNRHGLVANGMVTRADGYAEREAAKSVGNIRQVMVRGLQRVDQWFMLNMAAYNFTRLRGLPAQVRAQHG